MHTQTYSILHVLVVQERVILNRRVLAEEIKAEAIRRPIVLVEDTRPDGAISAETRGGIPNHLHSGCILADGTVLVVDASKVEGVKAHEREQRCLGGRVAKRVDVPSDGGEELERAGEEFVPDRHVVDDGAVVCGSLDAG